MFSFPAFLIRLSGQLNRQVAKGAKESKE